MPTYYRYYFESAEIGERFHCKADRPIRAYTDEEALAEYYDAIRVEWGIESPYDDEWAEWLEKNETRLVRKVEE